MKVLHTYNLDLPIVWKGYMWGGVEVIRLCHLTKWHLCWGIGAVLLLIGVAYAKGWGWGFRELYPSMLYGRPTSSISSFFPCLVFLVFCLDRIKSSLWFWRGIYVGKKKSNVIMFVCVCTQKLNSIIFNFWVSKQWSCEHLMCSPGTFSGPVSYSSWVSMVAHHSPCRWCISLLCCLEPEVLHSG